MKSKSILCLISIAVSIVSLRSQNIEDMTRDLPPHVSVLTTWGVRPEWDKTGENVYFLHRLLGDVFKINVKTRAISAITNHLHHPGIQRCMCLSNGDLLLGIGDINTGEMERDKAKLAMFVLKKNEPGKLYPLGAFFGEGPAVSKTSMKVAWTMPGQLEIKLGEIIYEAGTPKLTGVKTIIDYRNRDEVVRLETQDFRPPNDKELIFTHYQGPVGNAFVNADVHSYNLETGAITDHTRTPDDYDEAEGVFPDGAWSMIESDRHLPAKWKKKYKVDIFRMKLDGSGEVQQLADLAQRFPEILRSDNPVVDKTGRYVAYQFGFSQGEGAPGQGIFLLDLEKLAQASAK